MNRTAIVLVAAAAIVLVVVLLGTVILVGLPTRKSYEYRVCNVQGMRLTYVNAEWQGTKPPNQNDVVSSLNSCPQTWDYLQSAGRDGWELVTAVPLTAVAEENAQIVYLRRIKR